MALSLIEKKVLHFIENSDLDKLDFFHSKKTADKISSLLSDGTLSDFSFSEAVEKAIIREANEDYSVWSDSTYHHDILTQPIQNYVSKKGWTLVDCAQGCADEKATLPFWERAYGALERKIG